MAEDHHAVPNTPSQPDSSDFNVDETWVGQLIVVPVSGNVDMLSAPQLADALESALAKNPNGLVVDLSRVEFLGSAGISVLMAAHGKMADPDRFAVVADGPATHRPLTLLGLNEVISLHRTLDGALSRLADA